MVVAPIGYCSDARNRHPPNDGQTLVSRNGVRPDGLHQQPRDQAQHGTQLHYAVQTPRRIQKRASLRGHRLQIRNRLCNVPAKLHIGKFRPSDAKHVTRSCPRGDPARSYGFEPLRTNPVTEPARRTRIADRRRGFRNRTGGRFVCDGRYRADMFLLSVYTGLRISDVLALTPHDVRIIDGERWLYRKTIKTGAVVEIPLSRIFGGKGDRILLKYGIGKGIDDRYFKLSPNVTNSIREFCTAAGITKRVTFHTARRTSATLLQSMGIATNVVQKILGHSNISTTQIYAQTTHDQIATAVKTAFAQ